MMGVHVMPIAKGLSIPLVVHFHGFDAVMHDVIKELGEKYKVMFSYASAIVVVSKKMAQKIEALGCPPEKIRLNTYGVHADYLKIDPTYSEKTLVGLGRFVDKKAPYYTILAFQKALSKHPDAKLIIGGDGPLYDVCINLVKYWGLENSVELPGLIKPADFKKYLATARAFVQHSITPGSGDMEGTPLSVLEAQASALPVVATYHAGIPDVVLHEETGLLCEEHDVAFMAKNMERVLGDIDLARKMGKAGRERYIAHFTLERHLAELGRIVHESVKSK
jgi:glycosyltransferase involved in cell wall biosynthesis